MNILVRLKLHWFVEAVKTLRVFKNWPTILLANFFTDSKTMVVKLRDGAQFRIRRNRKDAKVIREVYSDKIYHRYIEYLKKGGIVIDIGANIGAFSVLSARCNKGVRVYSYEPFEENYHLLKENAITNGIEKQIHTFNQAVGNAKEERVIFADRVDSMSSLYGKVGKEMLIKVVSLKDVFVDNNIQTCDFLKVDCEGAEYEIFYSAPKYIFDRIETISIEFHEKFGTGKGKELKEFLEKQAFRCSIKGKSVGYIFAEKPDK